MGRRVRLKSKDSQLKVAEDIRADREKFSDDPRCNLAGFPPADEPLKVVRFVAGNPHPVGSARYKDFARAALVFARWREELFAISNDTEYRLMAEMRRSGANWRQIADWFGFLGENGDRQVEAHFRRIVAWREDHGLKILPLRNISKQESEEKDADPEAEWLTRRADRWLAGARMLMEHQDELTVSEEIDDWFYLLGGSMKAIEAGRAAFDTGLVGVLNAMSGDLDMALAEQDPQAPPGGKFKDRISVEAISGLADLRSLVRDYRALRRELRAAAKAEHDAEISE